MRSRTMDHPMKHGTTYWDEPDERDGWVPEPKPWCPSCCVPLVSCGCPVAERILDDEAHITRGSE